MQNMIARLEEVEQENTAFRIDSDKKLYIEKQKILEEVEDLRKREETLEA